MVQYYHMFDFHEKRKIRSIVYSKPVVAVLMLVTIILSFSVYHRYTVAEEMKQKLNVRENELNELKQRAATLESKVQYLRDERGIEEELRNRFDVVKEGEQVITAPYSVVSRTLKDGDKVQKVSKEELFNKKP